MEKAFSFITDTFWDYKIVGAGYATVLVSIFSFLMISKYVSNKFVNFLKLVKILILVTCSVVSLKYLDIDLKRGVNLIHIYNIIHLLDVLEDLNYNKIQQEAHDENEKKKLETGKEEQEPEEEMVQETYSDNDDATMEAMYKTEKQVEEITYSILKNVDKNRKENEAVLREKEILDEIKKKEAEEERIMKEKQLSDNVYRRKYYKKKKSWVYTLFSKTFYIFFYLFYWNLFSNVSVLKIYITLQMMNNLTSLCSFFLNNKNNTNKKKNNTKSSSSNKSSSDDNANMNANIKLIRWVLHCLDILYLTGMSVLLTQITYTPDINKKIYFFASTSVVFFTSYVFVSVNTFLSSYYKQFRPSLFCFLVFFHVFAIIGLVRTIYHPYGKSLFIQCIVIYIISGFGITLGAHRMWSHRAFEAHPSVQFVVFILNCIANQGSIITWSKTHRLHHKYSDTKYDPHNINRGFFYSHVGWLLYKKPKTVKEKEKEIFLQDLEKNWLLYIQHRFDPYLNLFISFILPGVYTFFVYDNYWDGFFILGALRWVITLHATWSINSFSHSFGYKPYNIDIKPTNNIFTSLVALGEGSHNYHHVFPSCYAMNENFYIININPTKYIIDVLYHLGLVWNLKSAQNICKEVRIREAKKLEERTKILTQTVKNKVMKKEEDTSYINEFINSFQNLYNDYLRISIFRYILYFLRDILIIVPIFCIHLCYCYYAYGDGEFALFDKLQNLNVKPFFLKYEKLCSISFFFIFHILLYAIPMGTMFTSLYSLIYECRRGLMFKHTILNNFVGCIISSFILLPYSPDDKNKKSLLVSLNEDFFKIFKGPLFMNKYTLVLSFFLLFYGGLTYAYGTFYFSIFFILPYIVFNIWLLLYIFLLKNPPLIVNMGSVSNNDDMDINVLNYIVVQSLLQWKMQNSIYQSKKKLIKILFYFINFIHHHLCYTYIVEYIHSKIPSYKTKEMYQYFDEKLDQYFFMRNEKFVEILKEFL